MMSAQRTKYLSLSKDEGMGVSDGIVDGCCVILDVDFELEDVMGKCTKTIGCWQNVVTAWSLEL